MDFYIDLGFAVLLRLLKDRRERTKFEAAFKKVYDAIGLAFNPDEHRSWLVKPGPSVK